jgi:DNA-binding MarR family transcriptional regulator
LQAHLGYWLRFVSNQVSQAFATKIVSLGVTVAEWVLMRELYDDDALPPSTLAERMGMTRGGVSKLVDRLAARGLLIRTASAEDRRYKTLSLTAKARTLVQQLSALADRNDAEFFGHLKQAERQSLEHAMRELVRRHGFKAVPVE